MAAGLAVLLLLCFCCLVLLLGGASACAACAAAAQCCCHRHVMLRGHMAAACALLPPAPKCGPGRLAQHTQRIRELTAPPPPPHLLAPQVTGKTLLDSISYGVDGLGTPNGTGRLLQTAGAHRACCNLPSRCPVACGSSRDDSRGLPWCLLQPWRWICRTSSPPPPTRPVCPTE